MICYRLRLVSGNAGEAAELSGEFSHDLWSLLGAYCEPADRLAASEWSSADCPESWRLVAGVGVVEENAPTAAQMHETLHLLRPFVLQSEWLYFPSVIAELERALDHDLPRAVIRQNRRIFSGKDMRALYRITRHELELTTEDALDAWLDVCQYHPYGKKSAPKRERFLTSHGGLPDALATAVFRDRLRAKVFAIVNIRNLIRRIEQVVDGVAG